MTCISWVSNVLNRVIFSANVSLGSGNVARFRSPQEFIPHAYWLMTDTTGDRTKCYCKYCTKIPQRNISDAFGLTQLRNQISSFLPTQARVPNKDPRKDLDKERRRNNRRELQRVFANVRHAPKPIKLPKGPKEFVLPEREKDMRALLGPKRLASRRWAREGELVWVKLDIPIMLGPSPKESISFWPGVIDEFNFKAEIIPTSNVDKGKQPEIQLMTENDNKNDDDEKPLWNLNHMWLYKIRLFVVSKTVVVGDSHILPYQSFAPETPLLSILQSIEIDPGPLEPLPDSQTAPPPSSQPNAGLQLTTSEMALLKNFEAVDPFPLNPPTFNSLFEQEQYIKFLAGAYIMAIQIAARVTMFWTPTDEFEVKHAIPDANSRRASAFSSASHHELPPDQSQALGVRLLGAGVDQGTFAQKRYQGLWWGSERIWIGELVRLKLARFQLAPDGAEMIKPPSGSGKHARSNTASNIRSLEDFRRDQNLAVSDSAPVTAEYENRDGKSTNADELGHTASSRRSLFMRIDGIFIVQVPSGDVRETHNECRISGMIYELADDDWDSDLDEGPDKPSSMLTPVASQTKTDIGSSPSRPTLESSGLGGARGLAQLYNNSSAQRQAQVQFPPNPALLSDDSPMNLDEPPPPPPASSEVKLLLPAETSDVSRTTNGRPSTESENVNPPTSSLPPSSSLGSEVPMASASASIAAMNVPPSTPPPSSQLAPPPSSSPGSYIEPSSFSLSGPARLVTQSHPLPPAPTHLRFRPILRAGYESVLPLTLLAGRYYPELLSSPLLSHRIASSLHGSIVPNNSPDGTLPVLNEGEASTSSGPASNGKTAEVDPDALPPTLATREPLWALMGLYSGAYNAVDSTAFLPSRIRAVREAERVAWTEISNYWRARAEQRRSTIVID